MRVDNHKKTKYIFIIDTDSYAGNFEREMCAYLTGVIGECNVGEEFSSLYRSELLIEECDDNPFDDYIEQRADDRGTYRPCSIWETKGWLFNGKDESVPEKDFNQKIANDNYRKAVIERHQRDYANINKIDTTNAKTGWSEKDKIQALEKCQKEIDKALNSKAVCPRSMPYNSVAIFFEKKPRHKMIESMKKRSYEFAKAKREHGRSWEKDFELKILGFRLIQENTSSQSRNI